MSTLQLQVPANKAVTPPLQPFKISLVNYPGKPAVICHRRCIVFNPMPREHILVPGEWNLDNGKGINNKDILRRGTNKDILRRGTSKDTIKEGTRDINSRDMNKGDIIRDTIRGMLLGLVLDMNPRATRVIVLLDQAE
jgi:hypothetical protein